MYIIFEAVSSDDPRLDPRITVVGKFWHHTIAFVLPEDEGSVITSWLNGETISAEVAKSAKFTAAYEGELSVLTASVASIDDLVIPTSGGNAFYKKETYFLTETDVTNAIECMKAGMRLFTRDHLTDEAIQAKLYAKIEALAVNDLNAAQVFMAEYFDVDTAYTNGRPRNPEFVVNWIW